MKQMIAPALALVVACSAPAVAAAHHKSPVPKAGGPKLVQAYAKLYKAASPGVRGRDVVTSGRAKDGRKDWNLVRSEANRLWLVQHPTIWRKHQIQEIFDSTSKKWPYNKRRVFAWWTANGYPEWEFVCMAEIVDRYENASWETNRSYGGYNNTSIAYGIPQANPGYKMSSAGSDWATNPITQFRWMRGYVNGRFGGACQALAHRRAGNSY